MKTVEEVIKAYFAYVLFFGWALSLGSLLVVWHQQFVVMGNHTKHGRAAEGRPSTILTILSLALALDLIPRPPITTDH